MGIPHLITTLEPYAVHQILHDEKVVIDGPALAYHILHTCRANGASQPSYLCLGRAAIAWLDELQSHRVTIQAIYFDGHLPASKQSVRMERMIKSTTYLSHFFSINPKGCASKHVMPRDKPDGDLFKPGKPENKPFMDPSFLVPAIIDALRSCPRYKAICFMVPGEADGYCAGYVAQHGGIVMTSDSDLLAHDLADGKVVLLRDVHKNADSKLTCATFAPRSIYRKLGLPHSVETCRPAYERRRSPHTTLPSLLKACSQPMHDEVDYQNFCQQYLHHETVPLPPMIRSLNGLDPRLSELLLQLGYSRLSSDCGDTKAKIFLPILVESPARGTAWEPSTPVRQLAYTIAGWIVPHSSSICIQEYRRVQQLDQKGREIRMIAKDAATHAANELLILMNQVVEKARGMEEHYWLLLCLILDILECEKQGKYSHALYTLQQAGKASLATGDKVPWETIHFVAQLQAGYYSLRILSQVLSIIMPEDDINRLPTSISQIRESLSELPSLFQSPDVGMALDFLRMVDQPRLMQVLKGVVHIPEESTPKATEAHGDAKIKKDKPKKKQSDTSRKMPIDPKSSTRGNMFSLLSVD